MLSRGFTDLGFSLMAACTDDSKGEKHKARIRIKNWFDSKKRSNCIKKNLKLFL